jgi:NET1-associated nuclear protein 1 (U3 small nucleolar RNA-associated protein 17)
MGSHIDANGETASMKKRKREPKDETSPLLKRHRSKSKSKQPTNGIPEEDSKVNGTPTRRGKEVVQHISHDVELVDSSTPAGTELAVRKAQAPWKLSNPMGGRMLDIDPIFSSDERLVQRQFTTPG